jgi:hypothetical protein
VCHRGLQRTAPWGLHVRVVHSLFVLVLVWELRWSCLTSFAALSFFLPFTFSLLLFSALELSADWPWLNVGWFRVQTGQGEESRGLMGPRKKATLVSGSPFSHRRVRIGVVRRKSQSFFPLWGADKRQVQYHEGVIGVRYKLSCRLKQWRCSGRSSWKNGTYIPVLAHINSSTMRF